MVEWLGWYDWLRCLFDNSEVSSMVVSSVVFDGESFDGWICIMLMSSSYMSVDFYLIGGL